MTRPHADVARPLPTSPFDPAGPWSPWWLQPLLEAQRLQWSAWLGWQQSFATLNKDLWEQWAVRYAGGAPLDG